MRLPSSSALQRSERLKMLLIRPGGGGGGAPAGPAGAPARAAEAAAAAAAERVNSVPGVRGILISPNEAERNRMKASVVWMMVPLSVSPLGVLTVSPRALSARAKGIAQTPRAVNRPARRDEPVAGIVVTVNTVFIEEVWRCNGVVEGFERNSGRGNASLSAPCRVCAGLLLQT